MDESQREKIGLLLEQALAEQPERRARFLDDACGRDAMLREEVASLLTAFESSSGYFERVATEILGPVLGAVAVAPDEAFAPGRTVSHYEILDRIGNGAMGIIYRARDLRLDRIVALKFLPSQLTADDAARARLFAEARAASALDHPNIGVVHDIGEADGGGLFIAMAWYAGETLRDTLRRGPLSVPEAIAIARQLADGLTAAHEAGIVHRDVKPSNILRTPQGHVKLVDFGIARFGDAQHTGDGATLGTVAYMSPEQTRSETIDGRSDVWSLGVVLYEMLAGHRPFPGADDQATIYAIRNDEPPPIGTGRADVPSSLAAVVATCMAKDPAQRYARMAELAADLRALEMAGDSALHVHARRKRMSSATARIGATIALGAALLITAAGYMLNARSMQPTLQRQRVVVATFENRTGDRSLDAIGNMAADWVIQGLSLTGVVDIVPVMTAMGASRFAVSSAGSADSAERIRLLARETGAAIVVSGSYYLQGDSLYLHSRITDAIGGHVLHSLDPVSSPSADPLAAVEQLRMRVMAGLAPHLDPRVRDHATVISRTPSYEAYREYAQGMDLLLRGEWRGALVHFSRATALDPAFTLPLVRSASIYDGVNDHAAVDSIARLLASRMDRLAEYDRQVITVATARARGDYATSYRAAVRGAELAPNTLLHYQVGAELLLLNRPREAIHVFSRLDPQRGELRGWNLYWIKLMEAHHRLGEYRQELQVARRARALDPLDSNLLRLEMRALIGLGRVAEAMRALETYLASPGDGRYWSGLLMRETAVELRAHGHDDAAAPLIERSLAWYLALSAEEQARRRRQLADAYYLAGRWDDAEQVLRPMSEQFPSNVGIQGQLGTLAARRGDRAEADRISAWLEAQERPYLLGEHTWWRARIAALLGEPDLAITLLGTAYAHGMKWWLPLHFEPDLAGLRKHPAFRELARPKG